MKTDKKLLLSLNQPLSITKRPFRLMAKDIGIDEERLLSLLKKYKKNGLIRRFGAILHHQKVGLKTNALIAWKVKPQRINKVAKILVKFPEISHCYLRATHSLWPYNLYTMVHCTDKEDCIYLIRKISQKVRIKDYCVLFTLQECKKTRTDLSKILK